MLGSALSIHPLKSSWAHCLYHHATLWVADIKGTDLPDFEKSTPQATSMCSYSQHMLTAIIDLWHYASAGCCITCMHNVYDSSKTKYEYAGINDAFAQHDKQSKSATLLAQSTGVWSVQPRFSFHSTHACDIPDLPISVELPLICFCGVLLPELACQLAHCAVLCLMTL